MHSLELGSSYFCLAIERSCGAARKDRHKLQLIKSKRPNVYTARPRKRSMDVFVVRLVPRTTHRTPHCKCDAVRECISNAFQFFRFNLTVSLARKHRITFWFERARPRVCVRVLVHSDNKFTVELIWFRLRFERNYRPMRDWRAIIVTQHTRALTYPMPNGSNDILLLVDVDVVVVVFRFFSCFGWSSWINVVVIFVT